MIDPNEQRTLDVASEIASRLDRSPMHTVAAAAMDTSGRIHSSVNAFHFTGGLCAELAVIAAAAAVDAGPLVTMVAVGDGDRGVISPCGRCRQVLLDSHPDCHVILPMPSGLNAVPIWTLLPYAYQFPNAVSARFVRFNPRYYDSMLSGRKTATIRYQDPIAVGPAILVFEDPDGYRHLHGMIERVDTRRLDELTDDDAHLEAASSADELRLGLRSHYPNLADDAHVDFVRFHLVGDDQAGSRS